MATKRNVRKQGTLPTNMVHDRRYKTVLCEVCHRRYIDIDANAISGTCYICIGVLVPFDDSILNNRPRGWKFMKYFVESDGSVFSYGEPVPELNGTLPVTDVDELRRKSKESGESRKLKKKELAAQKEAELLLIHEKQKEAKKHKANVVVQDVIQNDKTHKPTVIKRKTSGNPEPPTKKSSKKPIKKKVRS